MVNRRAQKRIYLDNAATSFPKAPGLGKATSDFLERDCMNLNRTNGKNGFGLFEKVYDLRRGIAKLYGLSTPESVCFTGGLTESLNLLIKGLFSETSCGNFKSADCPACHVIVSSCEHNSVMRPLVQEGIAFSRIPSDREGYIKTDEIEKLIRPNTKAMIICAAGNVTGAVQDINTITRIACKHKINLFIDSAQATPFIKLDMEADHIAGIAFTAHKGLLGPEGIGGIALRKDIAQSIPPLISGGTGSQSDSENIPTTLPDRLEAGTQNLPGLIGFYHSLAYIEENLNALRETEMKMTQRLGKGIESINGLHLVGAPLDKPRTSVISVVSDKLDISEISALLSERYNIETRVGMHCSPSSHKSIGTFPNGTLRFSPGPFTTEKEIDITIEALKEIMGDKK